MGLDMYLRGKRYLWGSDEGDKAIAEDVAKAIGKPELRVREVSVLIGDWRKANAIHNWFVENVQDGEDDCRPYFVDSGQLDDLRELCIKLLATKDVKAAAELLPVAEGFFFGSQEYDGWYWQDLAQTVDIIDSCNALGNGWEFEYQSSW